jgi:hypothetical protein
MYDYDRRAAKRKNYRVDMSVVRKLLASINDPEGQAESRRSYGGYSMASLEMVPLKDINLPTTWNPSRTERLQEAFDKDLPLPPVRLSREGNSGKWQVEDGIHRTNESKRRGYTHVPAIVTQWVETPNELVKPEPEKDQLPLGAWVKLRKPEGGRSFGWVEEQLGSREMFNVRRWMYSIALVKAGDDWPDFVDQSDLDFDPTSAPPWGQETKAKIQQR